MATSADVEPPPTLDSLPTEVLHKVAIFAACTRSVEALAAASAKGAEVGEERAAGAAPAPLTKRSAKVAPA